MRGKAISFGETKIILNVFSHFETDNSSFDKNAVITLNSKATGAPRTSIPRIINMELNRQAKLGLTVRKNLTSWMSSTWEWSAEISSKIRKKLSRTC